MPRRSRHSSLGSEYETVDIEAELSGVDSTSDESLPPQQNKKHLKSHTHGGHSTKRSKSKGKQRKISSDDSDSGSVEVVKVDKKSKNVRQNKAKAMALYKTELKKAQLELNKFKIENKELKLRAAEQTTISGPSKKSKGSKSAKKTRSSDSEDEVWQDRAALLARKFGVMNEIFVEPKHFMVEQPDIDPHDTINRYVSPQSRMAGLTAELFREIPEDLHELLVNDSKFRDTFITKLNDNRRQIVLRLRNTSAPTIFEVSKANYEPNTDRSKIPEFIKAIYFDSETKKFSKYAPILFPGGKFDMEKLFKCKHLALMLRSILFGSSSLTSSRKLGGPKTMGDLWGVEFVTPGAIALVSVLAIFLHSKDSVLAPLGAKSDIPYQDLFNKYKTILVANMKNGDQITEELFDYYNNIVFGWRNQKKVGSSKEDTGKSDSESSGIEGAIRQVKELQINSAPVETTASTVSVTEDSHIDIEPMHQNPSSAETTSMAAGPSNATSVTVSDGNHIDVGPAHQVEAIGTATGMQDDHDLAENRSGPAPKVRKHRKRAVPVRKSPRQRY